MPNPGLAVAPNGTPELLLLTIPLPAHPPTNPGDIGCRPPGGIIFTGGLTRKGAALGPVTVPHGGLAGRDASPACSGAGPIAGNKPGFAPPITPGGLRPGKKGCDNLTWAGGTNPEFSRTCAGSVGWDNNAVTLSRALGCERGASPGGPSPEQVINAAALALAIARVMAMSTATWGGGGAGANDGGTSPTGAGEEPPQGRPIAEAFAANIFFCASSAACIEDTFGGGGGAVTPPALSTPLAPVSPIAKRAGSAPCGAAPPGGKSHPDFTFFFFRSSPSEEPLLASLSRRLARERERERERESFRRRERDRRVPPPPPRLPPPPLARVLLDGGLWILNAHVHHRLLDLGLGLVLESGLSHTL
eukprot:CAMPEP_0177525518 /NCGR_PEP_ID=MMETSP0369-20130122/50585_2 /TAXON_ID=447022 ORGANISM="Scrippsiella hangoei-like, Strain SHHI-4" /NCGR_SAMPLE_ID=MMETSP0369 /ASSEMBLY_ACC=CAM_ASM_000364 /LENGTH=360 /DNA_ID=CAMNT_0019005665 /DNA_START=220 /DNA_END=1299 /DNA_ORIENTATION=-